ncbi:MAG: outer membrane protein assembly factor BamD [Calditrichaceae bacterium]|nr:outer membrane protein assembly factor BamD [Calditrichaceae bacterium]
MYKYLFYLFAIILFVSCAGNKPQPDWTASQYFKYAKDKFDDEDYYEASNEFTVVVLRYAGSTVADSAQFYLAECHFNMDEYIIAAAEFEKLINYMSRSPLVKEAQYKLAESYYQISPRPALDQNYTEKAMREFQNFIEDYPTHELKESAEKRILECREKLAEKQYKNADNYRKMREFNAAIIYYSIVIDEYYDTSFADDALIGKMKVHKDLKDFESVKADYVKFKELFPQSDLAKEADEFLASLPEEFKTTEN